MLAFQVPPRVTDLVAGQSSGAALQGGEPLLTFRDLVLEGGDPLSCLAQLVVEHGAPAATDRGMVARSRRRSSAVDSLGPTSPRGSAWPWSWARVLASLGCRRSARTSGREARCARLLVPTARLRELLGLPISAFTPDRDKPTVDERGGAWGP
jgi:hypothetical protein